MRTWLSLAATVGLGLFVLAEMQGLVVSPSANAQKQAADSKAEKAKEKADKPAPPWAPLGPAPAITIDETQWPRDDAASVLIRFGLKDTEPTSWDGKVRAAGCRVARLHPWRFGGEMTVGDEAQSWKCESWLGREPWRTNFDVHLPDLARPFVRPGVVVDLELQGSAGAVLEVDTAQGQFRIELDSLLRQEQAVLYLDGRVSASTAVFARPLAAGSAAEGQPGGRPTWHDYPSVEVSPKDPDDVWFCYQTYSKNTGGDLIMVRRRRQGKWLAAIPISPEAGDYYRTALCFDSGGRLWAVTSAQVGGNWDLYGRSFADDRWDEPVRLTDAPQPDIHHQLVRGADGGVWLVWQGFRDGQSDILARQWNGREWGAEVRVSTSPANDWEPSAAAHPAGGIAVAWDGYEHGQYDIFCRRVQGGNGLGPVIRVTGSDNLEARASVACDRKGRLWIAYDTSGPHWGKDTGFWPEIQKTPQGTRLYESRGIGLSVVEPESGERLAPPVPALQIPLDASLNEQIEYPHLMTDGQGRLWLLFRRKVDIDLMKRGVGWKFHWELYATRFDAQSNRWTEPRLFSYSIGRLDMRPALALGQDRIWGAWACNHRLFTGNRPDLCNLFAGSIPLSGLPEGDISAAPAKPVPSFPPAAADPVHSNEKADLARIRDYTISCGDRTYHIYRGDMHRHTENSPDGGGDGSLLDAYRYALDAAGMDFLLVTDHNDGQREYDWWQREKSNDLFRVGQAFVGLYGYERSVGYPNGHRNVFFTRRGVRPLDIVERAGPGGKVTPDSGEVLYPYLRINDGICFSHTSATGMGTDWRDNDPQFEPLVEIFQGDRTNYEAQDAPWAAKEDEPPTQEGGYRPLGYVDKALAKGYKLGFQSSSDHLSTHLSYSCILAERNTRESLMDAMRRRHAYGATDNIIMDVRSQGSDGPKIMGDIFASPKAPTIRVKVIGTGALREVVVIKDNRVVYSTSPGKSETEFTFTDMDAPPGKESYYYVRAVQQNDRLAWASPMWITPSDSQE